MKNLKFIIMISVSLILFVIFELSRPKEIDWTQSFSRARKIPFGSYILYELLPDVFPGSKLSVSDTEIYRTLHYNEYENTNYIFVNVDFKPDKFDTEELLNFVSAGNNVFVSAFNFGGKFADTLNLSLNLNFNSKGISGNFLAGVTNDSSGSFNFSKIPYSYYFEKYDTANTKILGFNQNREPNFIVTDFGSGKIFIHSNPLLFTNYSVLDTSNNKYIFAALSHLPDQDVLWDENYKADKMIISTPLRFILSNSALRWSYYLAIITILLFMYFKGKRTQRLIPVVKPPENTTVKFIETISNLYYQKKSHKLIADKKIIYFFEFLRNSFYIDTNLPDSELTGALSKKTGVGKKEVTELLDLIRTIQRKTNLTVSELYRFNTKLEEFIKKIKE